MLELCVYVLGVCELRIMFWDSNFHFVKNFVLFTFNSINDWNISSPGFFFFVGVYWIQKWSWLRTKIGNWKKGSKAHYAGRNTSRKSQWAIKSIVLIVNDTDWSISNSNHWAWKTHPNIQLPHFYGVRSNWSPMEILSFWKKWQKRGVSSTDFPILLLSC